MNLTYTQRIIISTTLQDVLEEAHQSFKQRLKDKAVSCDSMEQVNNYNTFATAYFSRLRDKAPGSVDLIEYTHTVTNFGELGL
jgi:hypothetical protein